MLFLASEVLACRRLLPWPDFGVAPASDGELAGVGRGVAGAANVVRRGSGGSIPGIPPPVARQLVSTPNVNPRSNSILAPTSSRRDCGDPGGRCGTGESIN